MPASALTEASFELPRILAAFSACSLVHTLLRPLCQVSLDLPWFHL